MKRLVLIGLFLASSLGAEAVPEPIDFHGEPYRSPVPAGLEGAITISTETAFALWASGRVQFVDVLPQAPKPENLPKETVWREKPRHSILGAIWLPNTGYEELADTDLKYFEDGLSAVTQKDKAAPLVFFCLENCWMSWNAAKRAIRLGYEKVYWYPEGTDGWGFYEYPTEIIKPVDHLK